MKTKLQKLEKEYNQMVAYRLECNATGSKKNYTSADFDKEGAIVKEIYELKNKQ
jgi:hypothetical protein